MAKKILEKKGTLEIITSTNLTGEIQTKINLSRNFKAPVGRGLVEYIEEIRERNIEQYKTMHCYFPEINLKRTFRLISYNGRLKLDELSINVAS